MKRLREAIMSWFGIRQTPPPPPPDPDPDWGRRGDERERTYSRIIAESAKATALLDRVRREERVTKYLRDRGAG